MSPTVGLIIPVKRLDQAKSRLWNGRLGARFDVRAAREDLVVAMALDTVEAALAAEAVAQVLIVTTDPRSFERLQDLDVKLMIDADSGGLNAALRLGAREMRNAFPHLQLGALNADLPALLPADLDAAIRESADRRSYCADREGRGTTLLLAARTGDLRPHFGANSALAHRASAARPLLGSWPSLRRDVDTVDDLDAAVALGVGARTSAALGLVHTGTTRP